MESIAGGLCTFYLVILKVCNVEAVEVGGIVDIDGVNTDRVAHFAGGLYDDWTAKEKGKRIVLE